MQKHFFLFLPIMVTLSACTSLGTFQTGRVLQPKEIKASFGISTQGNIAGSGFLPGLLREVYLGYGLENDMDVSLRVDRNYTAEFQTKLQVFGQKRKPFAGSIALGAGFGLIPRSNNTQPAVMGYLPFYWSYDKSKKWTYYGQIRYIAGLVNDNNLIGENNLQFFPGAQTSFGLLRRENTQRNNLMFEVGYRIFNTDLQFPTYSHVFQVGFGMDITNVTKKKAEIRSKKRKMRNN